MHVLAFERLQHETAAVFHCVEAEVLLDHEVMPQILAAEVHEDDAGLGEVAGQQDTLDGFEFEASGVEETQIRALYEGAFLEDRRNIIFVGGTGTGKSHLAIAIAASMVRKGARVRFYNLVDLANELAQEKLNFRGEYYKLTLMSPFFNPGPIEYPDIPIYIAGVNVGLARLAGEVSDGFLVHPFHSPRYLEEVLLPAIKQGAHRSGRTSGDIKVSATVFVVSSPEEEEFIKSQISFYASTPSYRPVMALHGWGETAERLSSLASRGRWTEMPDQIDDDMLSRFAVVSPADNLASALMERYHGLADRITLYLPFNPGKSDDLWKSLLRDIGRELD